jgi:hypothetical protein
MRFNAISTIDDGLINAPKALYRSSWLPSPFKAVSKPRNKRHHVARSSA